MQGFKSDPRITAVGKAGQTYCVKSPRVWLYRDRADKNSADTELLYGHSFTAYKTLKNWIYGQAMTPVLNNATAGYVGWIHKDNLASFESATHRIISLKAPVFTAPDIKSQITVILPMGALVKHKTSHPRSTLQTNFIKILNGFIHRNHVAVRGEDYSDDFTAVAQSHLGLPYIWAGVSSDGLDCSGLVQSSLRAAGRDVPRDADMQEADLGKIIEQPPYKRGDLIFWPGHVGIMLSPETMIHANAHHMIVAEEPLSDAIARIGPIRTVKRL